MTEELRSLSDAHETSELSDGFPPPAEGPIEDRNPKATWPRPAAAAPGELQKCVATQGFSELADAPPPPAAVLATIKELHRRHDDLVRASVRLSNQAAAVCRRLICDCRPFPDPSSAAHKRHLRAAAALLRSVELETGTGEIAADALFSCRELLRARAVIEEGRAHIRRALEREVRALPLWTEWAAKVRGLGACSLGQILGESGDPARYGTVSKLWTRMGVGLVQHEGQWVRQRKVASAEGAALHQFRPARRALLYVVGENLVKMNDGQYRAAYDEKKATYLAREWTRGHAHNAAMRYATKCLLRDLWAAHRACLPRCAHPESPASAVGPAR